MILKDFEVAKLAKQYIKIKRSKTVKIPSFINILKSDKRKYFEQTVDLFSSRKGWDANNFISCLFEARDDIWPQQLPYEKNWETYLQYKNRYENIDINKDLVIELLLTYNNIKKWSSRNNKDQIDYKGFLDDKIEITKIKRGNTSILFLLFCKSFYDKFSKEEIEKILNGDINIKRMSIIRIEKIKNKLQKVLGKEFV